MVRTKNTTKPVRPRGKHYGNKRHQSVRKAAAPAKAFKLSELRKLLRAGIGDVVGLRGGAMPDAPAMATARSLGIPAKKAATMLVDTEANGVFLTGGFNPKSIQKFRDGVALQFFYDFIQESAGEGESMRSVLDYMTMKKDEIVRMLSNKQYEKYNQTWESIKRKLRSTLPDDDSGYHPLRLVLIGTRGQSRATGEDDLRKYHLVLPKGLRTIDVPIPRESRLYEGLEEDMPRLQEAVVKITIPTGIKIIGTAAFAGMTNLTSIELPDGLAHIGVNAFQNCKSLVDIKLPRSLVKIHSGAFRGCESLKEITLLNPKTEIGQFAFSHCSELTKVVAPEGVVSIADLTK